MSSPVPMLATLLLQPSLDGQDLPFPRTWIRAPPSLHCLCDSQRGLWATFLNRSPPGRDLELPRDELLQCAAGGYTGIGRTSAAAQLHNQGYRSRGNRSCGITQGGTTSRATNSSIPNVISTRRLGHLGWGASLRLLYSTMATRLKLQQSRRWAVLASGIPGQSMLPHCSDGARQELRTMDGWMRCQRRSAACRQERKSSAQ